MVSAGSLSADWKLTRAKKVRTRVGVARLTRSMTLAGSVALGVANAQLTRAAWPVAGGIAYPGRPVTTPSVVSIVTSVICPPQAPALMSQVMVTALASVGMVVSAVLLVSVNGATP